ncbi:pilus assembly protein PilM [Candidatus Babeliales bacterium]|nr:pilus assembly protein PilM [Candidatus Babeliales bacterium]
MMLELFIPEKFRSIRLLPKHVLGIGINNNKIFGSLIYSKHNSTIIEKIYSVPIQEDSSNKNLQQGTTSAIKKLVGIINKFDQLRISVSASKVIFKELRIPLTGHEKIRMIIEYEVEEQLPFSLDEAIIDFIVTKESKDGSDSQVLVAAIRKNDLQEILDIYTKAGINPTNITIDLFAIYDLYKLIPEYKKIKDPVSLVDVEDYTTTITLIQNNELRLIRTIPVGIFTIAQDIREEANISIEEAKNLILSGNLSIESTQNKIIQKHLITYLNEIQFTLNSFCLKLGLYKEINKILFTNFDPTKNEFASFASNALQIPCEILNIEKIFSLSNIKNKTTQSINNWHNYVLSLATALSSIPTHEFNFRRKSFELVNLPLMRKQINFALLISLTSIFTLSTFGYSYLGGLYNKLTSIETKENSKLQKILKAGEKTTQDAPTLRLIKRAQKETKFQNILKQMKRIVDQEQSAWIKLSRLKINALSVLLNITQIIDRYNFSVSINDMSISPADLETIIEISGLFRPKVPGEDFKEWFQFIPKIKESAEKRNYMLLDDREEDIGENGLGVKFTLKFKTKDK